MPTNSSDAAWGVAPETEVEILRGGRSKMVEVGAIKEGDFLFPGSGSKFWKCDGVEVFTSDLPSWNLDFSNGKSLVCTEGTVLAGAAGNYLPSSPGNRPSVVLLRQHVDTGEARRYFTVRLLNSTQAEPKVQKMFKDARKVYYTLHSAVDFMLKLKASVPTLDLLSGVEISLTQLENGFEFLPIRANSDPLHRPILPLFKVSGDPKPVVVATAKRNVFGYGTITRVVRYETANSVGARQWCRPIFRKCGENASFSANGIVVFNPDCFLSQRCFEKSLKCSTSPFFREGSVERRPRIRDLEGCLSIPCKAETVTAINTEQAADEFLLLAARMRASKITCEELLVELNSRDRAHG